MTSYATAVPSRDRVGLDAVSLVTAFSGAVGVVAVAGPSAVASVPAGLLFAALLTCPLLVVAPATLARTLAGPAALHPPIGT